jgi:hypothetical protein
MFSNVPADIFLFIRSYIVVFDISDRVGGVHQIIRKKLKEAGEVFLQR